MKTSNQQNQILIVLGAALLYIPFLGQVHLFDWDEINFAESAREMIETGDFLTVRIFFEPFWEKPPLFVWFQVISMKIFGVNEFAARFPNAICGIVTLLVLYNLGRRLYDERFGLIWAISYGCSLLPFFYFKSGIIDPWFNLFIFLSVYYYIRALDSSILKSELSNIVLSASMLGLAVLSKGPVSILVFGLLIFTLLVLNRFKLGLKWQSVGAFILSLSFVGGFWFMLQIVSGNFQVVAEFIIYQIRLFQTKDAGHGGFPMYHFVILLFGMFPASVFAIQGHKFVGEKDIRKIMHLAMIALLWIVLLLFTLVKTKIVHYSSLTYFPVSYLAAFSLSKIISGEFRLRAWQKVLIGIIGFILGILIMLAPAFIKHKDFFIGQGMISHSFTIGNLQADPGWTYFHSLIGVMLLAAIVWFIWFFRTRVVARLLLLFGASLLFIMLAMLFITPGAENISQRAAIEFIKSKSDEDVYIHSFYKSYATLFYMNQKQPFDKKIFNQKWLTKGPIDKDAYFIIRIDKKAEVLSRYPDVTMLYEKNGYVFCVRKARTKEDITLQND